MTRRFPRRVWIVLAVVAIAASHVLIPYLFFRVTVSVAAVSALALIVGKHVAAAATIWWARRGHRTARR